MKNYELTLVLDANFSSSEISDTKKRCEEIIGKSEIKEIDDIGLLTTAYPIRGQNQAYYVSYFLTIDSQSIPSIESELSIVKGLAKFFIYGYAHDEVFVSFGDMQKKCAELFPVEEEIEEEEIEENQEDSIEIDGE